MADDIEAENKRLREQISDYENRITWDTTCANCARLLDAAIRDHERAEKAEARLEVAKAAITSVMRNLDEWTPEWSALIPLMRRDLSTTLTALSETPQPEPVKCEHTEHAYAEHPGRASERIGRRWTAFGSDVGIWEPCPVKAMQWEIVNSPDGVMGGQMQAKRIVAWVNANGGEAQYVPDSTTIGYHSIGPLIAIGTANGWVYAKPGDWFTMTDAAVPHRTGSTARAFRVSGTAKPVKE